TFGIERTPYAAESSGLSSEFTLTTLTRPSNSRATLSMIGVSARHGPHHGAQKSTTTGCDFEASMTSRSKVAVVTSMTVTLRPPPADFNARGLGAAGWERLSWRERDSW